MELCGADSEDWEKLFNFDDFYIDDWLHVVDFNQLVEFIDYLDGSLRWASQITTMKDMSASGAKQDLEKVIFERRDLYWLDDHLVNSVSLANFEVFFCENVDSRYLVAVPMVVENLCVTYEKAVYTWLV